MVCQECSVEVVNSDGSHTIECLLKLGERCEFCNDANYIYCEHGKRLDFQGEIIDARDICELCEEKVLFQKEFI